MLYTLKNRKLHYDKISYFSVITYQSFSRKLIEPKKVSDTKFVIFYYFNWNFKFYYYVIVGGTRRFQSYGLRTLRFSHFTINTFVKHYRVSDGLNGGHLIDDCRRTTQTMHPWSIICTVPLITWRVTKSSLVKKPVILTVYYFHHENS